MRLRFQVVLLLFGASSAYGQTQAPSSSVESTVPVPAQAHAQPLPAPRPAPARPDEPTRPHTAARAEAVTAADNAEAQEQPKRRSRVLWFLVGAVVVLGIIVATQ